MPHSVVALLYIALASVFSFLSFQQFQKNNFRLSAVFLVAVAFTLRFFMASDMYLHEWDERYHALVAKNLMDNFLEPKLYRLPLLSFDYKSWSSNYFWLHKQPLPLWCMALSMKVFGVNEIAMRAPSVVVSSVAVYFTYFIGKKLFNEKIGLIAAFFHAVNGLVMDVTTGRAATDHIDIFFLFFVELAVVVAIVSSEKRKIWLDILTGVCIGLAVLCKWLPAFIVLPVWAILSYKKRSIGGIVIGAFVIVISAVVIFLPWQLYMHAKFPLEYANEMLHNYRHIVEVLDEKEGSMFYYFGKLHINVSEVFWVAFVWFCFQCYHRNNTLNRLVVLVWMIIPFIFFTAAQTKMQAYLLFVFPALFIIMADFGVFLLEKTESVRRMKLQKLAFALVIFLAIRFSIERIKPFQNQTKHLVWANEFRQMNKTNAEKRVYVNVKHCIEGMFYTNSIMYGYTPPPNEIEELKARGYEVIVNSNPDI